jgi:hypothetical protein
MVFAWQQVLAGVVTEILLVLSGVGGWLAYIGARHDDFEQAMDVMDVLGLGAILVPMVMVPIWTLFVFLSFRAVVEAIQVYLDIEDNTRAAAEGLPSSGDST